jgi:hypothetical protein
LALDKNDKDIVQHIKEYRAYAIRLRQELPTMSNGKEKECLEYRLKAVERCIEVLG